MTDCVSETFLVAFPGELVECESLEDANALKSARDLLADMMGCDPSPDDCDRLVGEPIHYRRLSFAAAPAFKSPLPTSDLLLAPVGA